MFHVHTSIHMEAEVNEMKSFFAVVGFIHVFWFVVGGFGFMDYHVCIKPAGQCSAKETK